MLCKNTDPQEKIFKWTGPMEITHVKRQGLSFILKNLQSGRDISRHISHIKPFHKRLENNTLAIATEARSLGEEKKGPRKRPRTSYCIQTRSQTNLRPSGTSLDRTKNSSPQPLRNTRSLSREPEESRDISRKEKQKPDKGPDKPLSSPPSRTSSIGERSQEKLNDDTAQITTEEEPQEDTPRRSSESQESQEK